MLSFVLNSGVESASAFGEDVVLFVFFTLLLGTLTRHLLTEFRITIPYTVTLLLLGLLW